jgi:NAD(P)H-hydrate epimerase
MNIPVISAQQMAEVDRLMIEVYQIDLIQMMENAGRNLADLALRMTAHLHDLSFLVIAGSGNNGGGGLVAARHLINRGYRVRVVLTGDETRLKPIPKHQWAILKNMGVEAVNPTKIDTFAVIIDAMIGYGLQGQPREPISGWIERINHSGIPILSLDVPSGLDATPRNPLQPLHTSPHNPDPCPAKNRVDDA